MRKILLFVILTAAAMSQAIASERIVSKPASLYQNMLIWPRIDSVALTDTATVFSVRVGGFEHTPFFISSETYLRDLQGRSYPLRRIISAYGLQPDEPRTFGDISKNSFDIQLVFPPLPADVKEVSLIDPQYFNHGIFGIRLDGTPLPPFQLPAGVEQRLKEIMAVQDTLPPVDYRFGWATVKGQLLEYQPGMCDNVTLVFGHANSFPRMYDDSLCAQVSPTGSFTFRLPVAHVTPVSLTFEPSQESVRGIVYVGPDEETEVYFSMREINQRYTLRRPGSKTFLYVTKGPLAQLANELNQHVHFYNIDFARNNLTHEEYSRYQKVKEVMPTQQLEMLLADLDTMKTDEQWSPAMKELVSLYWRMHQLTWFRLDPPQGLEEEARESAEARERLNALERDAVVALLDACERLVSNPKTLYCPDFNYMLWSIRYNALLPDYITYEKTVDKLRREMALYFNLLEPDDIADDLANLPPAYSQMLTAWQDKYRKERDRLAVKHLTGDTLKGMTDSLLFHTLSNRYKGHTVFIRFFRYNDRPFTHHVVLPLQRELADLDIIWVNVFGPWVSKWDQTHRLRDFVNLQGENYFYEQSSRIDRLSTFNKTMGIDGWAEAYFIVAPDGSIVRNSSMPGAPLLWMENQDYLGIRHCLRQTASPRHPSGD